ncbi:MAG: response regulator transcription factor [Ekhidna sp.]|nr:response regulator transcription factor [Ekhidna sp.]
MKSKVILADFQFLTRKGMAALIQAIPSMHLVRQVMHENELEDTLREVAPELAVVDVHGKEDVLIPQIAKIEGTSFLVISNTQNRESIQRLLDSGVKGILTKNCSEEEITNGLIAVSEGSRFFCNTVLEMMTNRENDEEDCEPTNITKREFEVIELITQGKSTAQIAEKLHLSVHTINSHRKNILKKLKLGSPAELIVYALESGLVR